MDDSVKIAESIKETLQAGGHPLTDEQFILMAGSLSVWIEKVSKQAFESGLHYYD